MVATAIQRLKHLCLIIPPLLNKIPETELKRRPSTGKWSKKEILGHLLDSATINHHRIIRAQFEDSPLVAYENDQWLGSNHYYEMDKEHLIRFWSCYNNHIAAVAGFLQDRTLRRKVRTGDSQETPHDLEFVITDYVRHLEHHLAQIVNYT